MGKVIEIDKYQNQNLQYKYTIEDIKQSLETMDTELLTMSINLATSGEWYKWSEEQGEGGYFEFDTEMLSHCNDPKVQALLTLKERVTLTINNLKP
jgi:hypothetical protein